MMLRAFSANIVILIHSSQIRPNPPAHTENNFTTCEPYWRQSVRIICRTIVLSRLDLATSPFLAWHGE
jgi:hypothetical protein